MLLTSDDFLTKINYKIDTIQDDVQAILDNDVNGLEYIKKEDSDFNELTL